MNIFSKTKITKNQRKITAVRTLVLVFAVLLLGSTIFGYSTVAPNPPATGAFSSGNYRNVFEESDVARHWEIQSKLNDLWRAFVTNRYVEVGTDMAIVDSGGGWALTEGMSYGMMICVQTNHQTEFNKLWKWAKTNMGHPDGEYQNFFAWKVNLDGRKESEGPAPDGEEYFAAALMMAAGRWGNGIDILDYQAEANIILDAMLHQGDDGIGQSMFNLTEMQIKFTPSPGADSWTDPSYHLPAFYDYFAQYAVKDKEIWHQLAEKSRSMWPKFINELGLAPSYANFDGTPYTGGFNGEYGPRYTADAWRTIMNAAVDYAWWADEPFEKTYANRVANFFKTKLDQGGGTYPGELNLDGTPYQTWQNPAAYVCHATAALAADSGSGTNAWRMVEKFWEMNIPTSYYDQLLAYMSFLHCSGNFKIYKPSTATPNRNPYLQTEAESYSQQLGIVKETCPEGGQDITQIQNNDYIGFKNVDFGYGVQGFDVRAAAIAGGSIEIRLDSPSGSIIGTCPVATGDGSTWQTISCDVDQMPGVHNVYFIFKGAAGQQLFKVNWLQFTDGTPKPVTYGPNLITNPSFENGNTGSWFGFGPSAITAEQDQAYDGVYGALVSGRTSTWNGMAQTLTGKMETGKIYQVSAWVRLKNSASDSVSISFKRDHDSATDYDTAASGTVTDSAWKFISGEYTALQAKQQLTGIDLYFQGAAVGTDFYVDNVSVWEKILPQDVPLDPGNIKVQMKNATVNETTNTIMPRFLITNTGTQPVRLDHVNVKYFYTVDYERPQNFWCDYATVGNKNVTGKFIKLSSGTPDANYCLEIGFKTEAGILAPGKSTEVHTRFAKNDLTNYNQLNDYSFNLTATALVDWAKTPGYVRGNSRWGLEPSLVANGGFEEGTTGWYGWGSVTMAATTEDFSTGASSILVSGRTATWQGVATNVKSIIQVGKTYEISTSIKLKNTATDQVGISMKQGTDEGDNYQTVASSNVSNSRWTRLTGRFSLSAACNTLDLYMEGPASGVDFYLDDVTVKEVFDAPTIVLNVQTQNPDANPTVMHEIPKIKLQNISEATVNLADVKIRYYYTIDGENLQSYWCDYASVGGENITATFGKLDFPVSDADHYVEIGFDTGAGSLLPGSSTEVQVRFAKSDWSSYTQTNDYSFNPSETGYTDWSKVTVYVNGTLYFGVQPQ